MERLPLVKIKPRWRDMLGFRGRVHVFFFLDQTKHIPAVFPSFAHHSECANATCGSYVPPSKICDVIKRLEYKSSSSCTTSRTNEWFPRQLPSPSLMVWCVIDCGKRFRSFLYFYYLNSDTLICRDFQLWPNVVRAIKGSTVAALRILKRNWAVLEPQCSNEETQRTSRTSCFFY